MEQQFTSQTVSSADGTTIGYHVTGRGPALLLIHGGFRHGMHYKRLADSLSDQFTVYLMDRRGRASSGPQGIGYSLSKECEDAIAIAKKHDIRLVFGHSYGGLVAMNVGLQYDFEKLAVYEPPIFISGTFPLQWLPRFKHQLEKRDIIGATITFIKGVKMADPLTYIPNFLLRPLFRMIMKKNGLQETEQLLSQLPGEMKVVNGFNTIEHYQSLQTSVLLLLGGKSPSYFDQPMKNLENILPHVQVQRLPDQGHNAPDEDAPEEVGRLLRNYFC
jgi:pimeloyl-ACP methyl ester carboxylesterase